MLKYYFPDIVLGSPFLRSMLIPAILIHSIESLRGVHHLHTALRFIYFFTSRHLGRSHPLAITSKCFEEYPRASLFVYLCGGALECVSGSGNAGVWGVCSPQWPPQFILPLGQGFLRPRAFTT